MRGGVYCGMLSVACGEMSKYMYNRSGRDTKNAIFLNGNFCPKLMRFIQIYRVWVYLSIVVELPHFCKMFFLSNVYFSLSLPDRIIIFFLI